MDTMNTTRSRSSKGTRCALQINCRASCPGLSAAIAESLLTRSRSSRPQPASFRVRPRVLRPCEQGCRRCHVDSRSRSSLKARRPFRRVPLHPPRRRSACRQASAAARPPTAAYDLTPLASMTITSPRSARRHDASASRITGSRLALRPRYRPYRVARHRCGPTPCGPRRDSDLREAHDASSSPQDCRAVAPSILVPTRAGCSRTSSPPPPREASASNSTQGRGRRGGNVAMDVARTACRMGAEVPSSPVR
jgi:hypothetical protein